MRSDSWMPFSGTNGTSGSFGYLNPQRLIERTLHEIPIRTDSPAIARTNARALPADIVETPQALAINLDMPGHDPGAMTLNLENQVLTVRSERAVPEADDEDRILRAEREYGIFTRSFLLPSAADGGRIEARYEQGVLTVTIPKREEAKPRIIAVKTGS